MINRLDLWPQYQWWSSTHQGISTYQVWSFWGKVFSSYQLHMVWETEMTFDLDLWPTDLIINRDHLLINGYLPTKFEASGAKRSWLIMMLDARCWRLTWLLTLIFDLNINKHHLLIKDYLPTKFEAFGAKLSWDMRYQLHKVQNGRPTWPWPTDLNINRDHLVIKDYLPRLPSVKLLGQSIFELPVAQG